MAESAESPQGADDRTGEGGASDDAVTRYADMDIDELRAEASRQGITLDEEMDADEIRSALVTSATGSGEANA